MIRSREPHNNARNQTCDPITSISVILLVILLQVRLRVICLYANAAGRLRDPTLGLREYKKHARYPTFNPIARASQKCSYPDRSGCAHFFQLHAMLTIILDKAAVSRITRILQPVLHSSIFGSMRIIRSDPITSISKKYS